jgi:gliding motility-associated-like protein
LYQFTIFNRWGQKIFETTDSKKGWNGKYKGEIAPNGVYLAKVNYNLKSIIKSFNMFKDEY